MSHQLVMRAISSALQPTAGGTLTLDPTRLEAVRAVLSSSAERNDPSAAMAVYEMVALLQETSSAAAEALMRFMMQSSAERASPPNKPVWGSR